MSTWGTGPFQNDTALDFLGYVEDLEHPGEVLRELLGAILSEENVLHDFILEMGIAASVIIAVKVEPTLDPDTAERVGESPSLEALPVTDDLVEMALRTLYRALRPWGRQSGTNGLYSLWCDAGEVEEHVDALRPYIGALERGVHIVDDDDPGPLQSGESGERRTADESETPLVQARLRSLALGALVFPPNALSAEAGEPEADSHAFSEGCQELALGSVVYAAAKVVQETMDDLRVLDRRDVSVRDVGWDALRLLKHLPWRFASTYDVSFARRFLVTVTVMADRLGRATPYVNCIADQLAARMLCDEAADLIRRYSGLDFSQAVILSSQVEKLFDFRRDVFDYGNLYASTSLRSLAAGSIRLIPESWGPDGFPDRLPDTTEWFTSFGAERPAHPYTAASGEFPDPERWP
ncbi:DUF4259 domain-containing protein [Streptosporangium carneum]|uniref:DUF4259 domain-containing protein n=1 Tax=Streptosporangium carneum TaxID=47481 RepID=A0A9W6I8R9_9ACTN|nr:DUF4259 domain-containing protein [Streptosporangium carneum]GLK13010.1 hypothetical protein GCM10017600_64200 [Streptosporangium carneum]